MKWEYKITNYDVDDNPPSFSELGLQGWELVSSGKYRHIFKRPLSEPDAKPVVIVHGANCHKVKHSGNDEFDGFGHGENDDGPYLIYGIPYCGRCHRWVGSYGEVKSVPSETDRLKSELATDIESKLGEMYHDILADGTTGVLKYADAVWLLDLARAQHEDIRTVKKELETACRRHAAELERAAQYKGISIQYREISGILCETVKPIVYHFESGRSSATIPDGYLMALAKAYRAAEVENGK